MSTPQISIVVPVYNEEGNLDELYGRLTDVLGELGTTYELLFVDDGSTDGSYAILERLSKDDSAVRGISFSRNFGHHLAITAGLEEAIGESVVLMDADLQDRPEAIPALYHKLEEGYDLVWGIRTSRQHSLFKRVTSRLFVAVLNRIASERQPINTHIFRIARRPVIDAVNQCREQSRFIVGLMSWVGFRQTGVEVPHGERFAGATKYSLFKMIALAMQAVTGFSVLPLRVSTYLGMISSTASIAFAIWLLVKKAFFDTMIEGWTSTIVAVLFLGGIQLVSLGVLGEYLGRVYKEAQARPLYVVAKRLNDPA